MARRSNSTQYAILGMLSLAPMSGYDVRKEAATSIGHFWSESYGQIYPALRDLASRGLARRRTERRAGRPERQVYEITERGLDALQVWKVEPPHTSPARNELLLKLFFGDERSTEQNVAWIELLLAEEKHRLRDYGAIRRQLMKEQRHHPSLRFWLITLSYGVHRSRSLTRWCRETLSALRGSHGGTEPTRAAGRKGTR